MRRALPYILIVVTLIVGAGIYLQVTKADKDLLNLETNQTSRSSSNENTPVEPGKAQFQNLGPAPEFTGINNWINSEPLSLEALRGKVVLIDFWTYSCINCIRTLPYVTDWYDKYQDDGFVIVGVHTPEFAFERVTSNVEAAIKRYEINYPVAQDNNYRTWSAYNNGFWPAHYLLDQSGNIVYTHFGEGKYEETELAIRTLLGLEGEFEMPPVPEVNQSQTREIYLGTARLGSSFGGSEQTSSEEQTFIFPAEQAKNTFTLEGKWRFYPESVLHTNGYGRIRLNFNAANVFMVAEAAEPTPIKIYVDGELVKGAVVNESDLYTLFESDLGAERTLEIEIPEGSLQIFTFTFG